MQKIQGVCDAKLDGENISEQQYETKLQHKSSHIFLLLRQKK